MWLLDNKVFNSINNATLAGLSPNAEQRASHISSMSDGASKILSIAGSSAEIKVEGVLTNKPDFMSFLFGGGNTTYSDIISAIAAVEADPSITDVTFAIDSPGGSVNGLFDTIAAIQNMKKRKMALVSNMAASAAFAIATQMDSIEATNLATTFGSVGIIASLDVNEDVVNLTSTNAPNKAPDPTTDEGKAAIVGELDAVHELFVEAIAMGRGTTIENINANFGKGGVFLSQEALKRGMIDSISNNIDTINTQTKVQSMNLTELQASHPDLYAQAVGIGENKERDRVTAHLTMGVGSGDIETAIKACEDGTEMTHTLTAKYMAAGMNKVSIDARADDDNSAGVALDNVNTDAVAADTDAETIAAGIEARFCGGMQA